MGGDQGFLEFCGHLESTCKSIAQPLCQALKLSHLVTMQSAVIILQVPLIIHTRQRDPFVKFLPGGSIYVMARIPLQIVIAEYVSETCYNDYANVLETF